MGGKSLRSLALQYVSPAQLNDSISLFEVRTHCMAWFALHNDTIYVLDGTVFICMKMCVIRGQLTLERVEIYVLSEFCCNKLILNVKFSEVIIFRNNPVTGYYFP